VKIKRIWWIRLNVTFFQGWFWQNVANMGSHLHWKNLCPLTRYWQIWKFLSCLLENWEHCTLTNSSAAICRCHRFVGTAKNTYFKTSFQDSWNNVAFFFLQLF
jgi:hypothetical protein